MVIPFGFDEVEVQMLVQVPNGPGLMGGCTVGPRSG